MLKTEKFERVPFTIDAVQVTSENMEEVAKWCKGEVKTETFKGRKATFIEVDVSRPMTERQKKAMVGDWVLFAGRGYKCYTNKAFNECFRRPSTPVIHVDNPNQQSLLSADDIENLKTKFRVGGV
jgi:hypothetical protein